VAALCMACLRARILRLSMPDLSLSLLYSTHVILLTHCFRLFVTSSNKWIVPIVERVA